MAVPSACSLALALRLRLAATALGEYFLWDFVWIGLEARDDLALNRALDQALDIAKEALLVYADQ